jgi:hypothetical protein
MVSEMTLCCELWKYKSKKSLQQIGHLLRCKSRFIAIGKPYLGYMNSYFLSLSGANIFSKAILVFK